MIETLIVIFRAKKFVLSSLCVSRVEPPRAQILCYAARPPNTYTRTTQTTTHEEEEDEEDEGF